MNKKYTFINILGYFILLSALSISSIILLGYDFYPSILSDNLEYFFWDLNAWTIFILMCIRPLSDIFKHLKSLRMMVPLRKELGILTASIVVSFAIAGYISLGIEKSLATITTWEHWGIYSDMIDVIFWGRIGFVTGVILLLTSNDFSIRILGYKVWKNIQRLSYVYFFAGTYYVWQVFDKPEELWFMVIVAMLTVSAFGIKKFRKRNKIQ